MVYEKSTGLGEAFPASDEGPNRLLILGSPGAGKSRLASELAGILRLPLHRMDDLYWRAGWQRPNLGVFHCRLESVLRSDRWMLDGNYASSLAQRLRRADAVVIVDASPWRCLCSIGWRGTRRMFGDHYSLPLDVREAGSVPRTRPLVDMRFLRKIVQFRRRTLPAVLAATDSAKLAYPPLIVRRGQSAATVHRELLRSRGFGVREPPCAS